MAEQRESLLPVHGWPDEFCWAIYQPDFREWWPFGAELAAKYSAQGCVVRLIDPAENLLAFPKYPIAVEPDPDKPPFSFKECVWYERAARHSTVYAEEWQTIRDWLSSVYGSENVMPLIGRWSAELGEWAGCTNLIQAYSPTI